jgi:hypothetical protein
MEQMREAVLIWIDHTLTDARNSDTVPVPRHKGALANTPTMHIDVERRRKHY